MRSTTFYSTFSQQGKIIHGKQSSKQRAPLRYTFSGVLNPLLYNYTQFQSVAALKGRITTCLLLLRFILLQYCWPSIRDRRTRPGTIPLFLVHGWKQVIWIDGLCQIFLGAWLSLRIEKAAGSAFDFRVILFGRMWHWGTSNWHIIALSKVS